MELYAKSYLPNGDLGGRDWRANLISILSNQNNKYKEEEGLINFNLAKPRDFHLVVPDCKNCSLYQENKCILLQQTIDALSGCPIEIFKRGCKIMEGYLERYQKRFECEDLLDVEKEFMLELAPGINLTGFKDLVLQDKAASLLQVVDYKTGNHVPSYKELRGSFQPQIYSIAARRLYPGYSNYFMIFDYAAAQPITVTYSEHEDQVNLDKIVDMWHKIDKTRNVKRRNFDYVCKFMCDRKVCDVYWDIINKI